MPEFKSPFLESVYRYMITRGYSKRTVATYIYWIRYFIRFHKMRHPSEMDAAHIEEFLTFLAVDRKVAMATQGLTFVQCRNNWDIRTSRLPRSTHMY
jgi:hypothetical protein